MMPASHAVPAISPCLWFDGQAEEAARFYVSVFPGARLGAITRYPEGGPAPAGSVMTVEFALQEQTFIALNGGPAFRFTPAVSLTIHCRDQEEVDYYWERLSTGGPYEQCGWVQDKYGLSWQIVPDVLRTMMQDPDPLRTARVMAAVLGMRKLDVSALERACRG
ncbi:VOC family protein [Bordetella sp. 2513F-2]